MSQKYSPEFKAKALRLIEERVRAEQCSGWAACTDVGEALGRISPHTLRGWWKQSRIDRGEAPGVSRRVWRDAPAAPGEPRAATRERDPAQGLGFFAAELDRPTTR